MNAPTMYKALNGVFCVFKPEGKSVKQVSHILQLHFAKDLNVIPDRPLRPRVVINEKNWNTQLPVTTTVPDLADHPLVVGPRYETDDFSIGRIDFLPFYASGVQVFSVGKKGRWQLNRLAEAKHLKVYQVQGELGRATDDFWTDGRTVEKSTYHHVTQAKVDRVVAAMQAVHQKHMFVCSGLDLQSQEAYDLASRGMPRPHLEQGGPVIYNIKCVRFQPPHFSLEVHVIHETCDYLRRLVHEIGLEMRTSAVCTQVRRVRWGRFSLPHALLQKHWHTDHVVDNIRFCGGVLAVEDGAARLPQLQTHDPLLLQDPDPQLPPT